MPSIQSPSQRGMEMSPSGSNKKNVSVPRWAKQNASSDRCAVFKGQNKMFSGYCIATKLNGDCCPMKTAHKYVPYCKDCMRTGDPSLAVLPHPRFGKFLAARRNLPKGYKAALFGEIFSNEKMPEADKEWGFETSDGYFINPTKESGSQIQFCQCPGPNEVVTVNFAFPHLMLEVEPPKGQKRKEKYGSMLFQLSKDVPKNHQLVMMYAESQKETETFFRERGIVRCDVWCPTGPTLLKSNARKANLKLSPNDNPPKPMKSTTSSVMKNDNKKSARGGKSKSASSKAKKPAVVGKAKKPTPKSKKIAAMKPAVMMKQAGKKSAMKVGKKDVKKVRKTGGKK